jgi:hypothetical protein
MICGQFYEPSTAFITTEMYIVTWAFRVYVSMPSTCNVGSVHPSMSCSITPAGKSRSGLIGNRDHQCRRVAAEVHNPDAVRTGNKSNLHCLTRLSNESGPFLYSVVRGSSWDLPVPTWFTVCLRPRAARFTQGPPLSIDRNLRSARYYNLISSYIYAAVDNAAAWANLPASCSPQFLEHHFIHPWAQ